MPGERIRDGREERQPRGPCRELAERHERVARDHLAVEDAGAVEAGGLDVLHQPDEVRHRRGARDAKVDANGHGPRSILPLEPPGGGDA